MSAKKRFRLRREIRLFLWFSLLAAVVWLAVKLFSDNPNKAYGVFMPKGYAIHGIDVSRYQGKVDWAKLISYRSGKDSVAISFAFIKATEGRSLQDDCFKHNWAGARKHNVIRGAYHYFIPSRSAEEQAQNFIRNVKLERGDLPPVLDVEEHGRAGSKKLQQNIKTWLDLVEKHYGMKPILYTYIDFYEMHLYSPEFDDYPLWIAHYYKKKLAVDEPWLFWQHTDRGVIEGIPTKVDFNVFNGRMSELKALCKK